MSTKVQSRPIVKEMEESYLDYAMSVIVQRALPDVRDGLKPVQRRILYAMYSIGLRPSSPFKKSATVVGEVLGKYHPHGDAAIYDSLVHLAQDFKMRYPLITPQGNFGSMDGDRAAAMRYCITGDSLVLTDQGIIPINRISKGEKDTINLKVLDYRGKTKKASRFFNSGKHNIIDLVTQEGYEIRGSCNHPLLVFELNEFGQPDFRWKLLEDITTNNYVLINRNFSLFSKIDLDLKKYHPRKNKRHKDVYLPRRMNKDLAFLLGALVSEGSFHRGQILFNNQDASFYNKVKSIIKKQFKSIKLYEREVKGECKELSIHHQKVVNFLHNIGLSFSKSDKKEIPFSVLLSKKESIRHFLISLFEGDGSVVYKKDRRHRGKSIELTYNSKSETLIRQLKTVLLNFGIVTTSPYQDLRNGCFKLIISGVENINNFHKRIGFFSDRKKEILAKIEQINKSRMSKSDWIPYLNSYLRRNYKSSFIKKNNFDRYNNLEKNYKRLVKILNERDVKMIDWLIKNKFFFDKVKLLREFGDDRETVYSVKVESDSHSFIANGFVNHNTEAKLAPISLSLLSDIEKNTVDFMPNFDASLKEPKVLPARLPSLLINGTMGIAVGMATDIPPHNLGEVCDAVVLLISNPKAGIEDLMKHIKGPDLPTGGFLYDVKEIKQVYATGRGSITCRGKAEIVETEKDKFQLVITEIPYQINKATLVQRTAELVRDKKIIGIKNIKDESSRQGIRIVIDLKKEANPKKILNKLYQATDLQTKLHVNMIALSKGIQPNLLNLKQILEKYIVHRQIVVRRRTEFDLAQAQARAHILAGLKIALAHLDAVIKTIKKSQTKEKARINLMKRFKLTKIQANAICEMRLEQLAGLERKRIEDEYKEKLELIKKLEKILSSPKEILNLIKNEVTDLKDKYADQRRTRIYRNPIGEIGEEDVVEDTPCIVILTQGGYIKRMPVTSYKIQGRGGKGVIGNRLREEDIIYQILACTTCSKVLFFTDRGRVFQLKAYEIPEVGRAARGEALVNFLQIEQGERVTAIINLEASNSSQYLFMATKLGIVKKTSAQDFKEVRHSGLIAINLGKDDLLRWVKATSGKDEIILVTSNGKCIRFREKDVRAMGRSARGVRGVNLNKDDEVCGMDIIKFKVQSSKLKVSEKLKAKSEKSNTKVKSSKSEVLLVISENGYGKKSNLKEYHIQHRGGRGVNTARITKKTGRLIAGYILNPEDQDLIVVSKQAQVIRLSLAQISTLRRTTQGVRIMRLKENDKAVSISVL